MNVTKNCKKIHKMEGCAQTKSLVHVSWLLTNMLYKYGNNRLYIY